MLGGGKMSAWSNRLKRVVGDDNLPLREECYIDEEDTDLAYMPPAKKKVDYQAVCLFMYRLLDSKAVPSRVVMEALSTALYAHEKPRASVVLNSTGQTLAAGTLVDKFLIVPEDEEE